MLRLRLVYIVVLCGLAAGHAVLTAAPQARPARPDPAAIAANVNEVLAAYTAGDDLAVAAWLRTAQGAASVPYVESVVLAGGAPWSRARAAFLLEVIVAASGLRGERSTPMDRARDFVIVRRSTTMLLAGRTLFASRPTPLGADPDEDRFEVLWHQVAIGVAQGTQQFASQQSYLDGAGPRLDEALRRGVTLQTRIPLARGIAAAGLCCWAWASGETIQIIRMGQGPAHPGNVNADAAIGLFTRAAEIPELRVEALIRGAVLLHKLGRNAEALAWFERVPAHTDRGLGYMHHVTRARLFDLLNRATDAAAAYEAALGFAPLNQRAGIGLAAALLRAGRPEDAGRVADETRRLPDDPIDPTQAFFQGDARFIPEWLAEIRRLRR
jgi:hypothetical protein